MNSSIQFHPSMSCCIHWLYKTLTWHRLIRQIQVKAMIPYLCHLLKPLKSVNRLRGGDRLKTWIVYVCQKNCNTAGFFTLNSFLCVSRMVHHPMDIQPTWHNCGKLWSQHGTASLCNAFSSPIRVPALMNWGCSEVKRGCNLNNRKVFLMFCTVSHSCDLLSIKGFSLVTVCESHESQTSLLFFPLSLSLFGPLFLPWSQWAALRYLEGKGESECSKQRDKYLTDWAGGWWTGLTREKDRGRRGRKIQMKL